MTLIKTLVAALFAVVVTSCKTLPAAESETSGLLNSTEPQVITRIEYLPGKVVTNPYPLPDSSLMPDVEPLTEEHISGGDIPPEDAMKTAVAWAKQYHELGSTYDVLRGWIIGVRAGQAGAEDVDLEPEPLP